jgi:xylan 1,4-beta-xylosidase
MKSVDWGQTQRAITNELYGIGLYGGVVSSISTQPTYKTNLAYFKPGLVRFHYAGLTNSSATDIRGWVDETNQRWDENRIRTVMDAIDELNSGAYGNYRPAKMVNIPDFPSWMRRVSYTVGGETIQLLDPSEYDNYAAFCAQLVTILKNQGRNVKYYTPTNERDDIYYVKWKNANQADKLDDLITIYNKAAVAMKQADPSIKVGGLEFARGDLTDQVRRFVRGAKPNLDFVAYHFYANGDPYASAESVYNRTMDAARHNLDIVNIVKQEGLNIPVFNTEFNINWAAQQDFKQTLSEGAVYDALIFVGAIDTGATATAGWNDRDGYYGKLNNDDGANSVRMGAHNLQMFNNHMTGDRVTSTSDNAAIVTMATKTGSRKSIAIINRSGSAQTLRLNFAPAWTTSANFSRYVAAPAPAYYYTGSVSYADATNSGVTVEPNSVTVLSVADSQNVTSNSAELSRSGWTASASASASGNAPGNALDGNGSSRWATGAAQTSGQWFQVDMGSTRTFDRIVLDAGGSLSDFPRRYEVYTTNDPNNLDAPLVTDAGIGLNGSVHGTGGGVAGAPTTITFAPQTKRYIRIVQKGSVTNGNWWGINELRVYSHGSGAPSANLLSNPGFEAGLANWGSGNGTIVSDAHSGGSALKVSGNGGHGVQPISTFTPGATYRLSAWGKRGSGDSGNIGATYWAGGAKTIVWLACPGSSYTACETTFTLPANTTSLDIGFWTNWGTLYYDDLSLVKL